MKYFFVFNLVTFTSLLLCGCPDSPDTIKPDPCEGVKPVVANFDTYEDLTDFKNGTVRTKTDTFVHETGVTFKAEEDYDTYEWHIGYDDRVWTKKEFHLGFPDTEVKDGESILVTFIGRRKVNKECLPNDDGVDTLKKKIVIRSQKNSKVFGKYIGGFTSNPKDTFTVEVLLRDEYSIIINNINRGFFDDSETGMFSKDLGYTSMSFYHDGFSISHGLVPVRGYMRLLPNNQDSIIIDYEENRDKIKRIFMGRRVK